MILWTVFYFYFYLFISTPPWMCVCQLGVRPPTEHSKASEIIWVSASSPVRKGVSRLPSDAASFQFSVDDSNDNRRLDCRVGLCFLLSFSGGVCRFLWSAVVELPIPLPNALSRHLLVLCTINTPSFASPRRFFLWLSSTSRVYVSVDVWVFTVVVQDHYVAVAYTG